MPNSIELMLISIKDSMEHLQDEVSAMAEMLESLSVNISPEDLTNQQRDFFVHTYRHYRRHQQQLFE